MLKLKIAKKIWMIVIVGVLMASVPIFSASAKVKTGDDGTTNWDFINPITHQKAIPAGYIGIYTATDLDNVRNNLSGKYILMNDIDLSDWGKWEPIDQKTYIEEGEGGWAGPPYWENTPFTGEVEGNGYVIKNMRVEGTYDHAGLFGTCMDATIRNLGIVNGSVNVFLDEENLNASASIGGISAVLLESTIENCYYTGTIISSTAINEVGGIVGGSVGSTIKECYNAGNITCIPANLVFEERWSTTGGIIGFSFITSIEKCFNIGDVDTRFTETSEDSFFVTGGIVGYIEQDWEGRISTVTDSYNAGSITASITSFEGIVCVGGIAGIADSTAVITNVYNVGGVDVLSKSEEWGIGGIVCAAVYETGYEEGYAPSTKMRNCYYLNNTAVASGNGAGEMNNVMVLTDMQMHQQDSYAGFDFETIWNMQTNGYPQLKKVQIDGEPEVGDANSDGVVNIFDIMVIRDHIFGKKALSSQEVVIADVNEDGVINIFDIMRIRDHIFGKSLLS